MVIETESTISYRKITFKTDHMDILHIHTHSDSVPREDLQSAFGGPMKIKISGSTVYRRIISKKYLSKPALKLSKNTCFFIADLDWVPSNSSHLPLNGSEALPWERWNCSHPPSPCPMHIRSSSFLVQRVHPWGLPLPLSKITPEIKTGIETKMRKRAQDL